MLWYKPGPGIPDRGRGSDSLVLMEAGGFHEFYPKFYGIINIGGHVNTHDNLLFAVCEYM